MGWEYVNLADVNGSNGPEGAFVRTGAADAPSCPVNGVRWLRGTHGMPTRVCLGNVTTGREVSNGRRRVSLGVFVKGCTEEGGFCQVVVLSFVS